MKYSNLLIAGLPKTFDVGYAADYIQPYSDDIRPEEEHVQQPCAARGDAGRAVFIKFS